MEFTIISASFNSKKLLEFNYELVCQLNPGVKIRWIVVQNTPSDRISHDLGMDDPRFEMIPGPVLTDREQESVGYGSFQHAKAINLAVSYTKAEKFLVLDPDFFILRPNWISIVLKIMDDGDLGFFGAPYHPAKRLNYKGFPCATCLFVNRKLLHENDHFSLDFSPVLNHRYYQKSLYWELDRLVREKKILRFLLGAQRQILKDSDTHLLLYHWIATHAPHLICAIYRDTGFQIFKYYCNRSNHKILDIVAQDVRSRLSKIVACILPKRLRRNPHNGKELVDQGSPLVKSLESFCEEYHWEGSLFAVHMNGASHWDKAKTQCQFTIDHLRSVAQQLTAPSIDGTS